MSAALLSLAVESWRFVRSYARVVAKLAPSEQARFQSQQRYFQKQLEEKLQSVGFTLVDLEGHSFDPGMAATAINLADFSAESSSGFELVVDQMLEPVIMNAQGLVKMGTVLLKQVETK